MGFTVKENIVIDRPRKDVWDYVVEHDEWRRPQVVRVRKLTPGPPGPGTQYEDTVQMMGREMKMVNEVLEFEPPSILSWTQVDEGGPAYTVRGSYELEDLDGKTRFTLFGEYEAGGLWRLLVPLIRRQLQNDTYPTFLRQLKDILERKR